VEDRINFLLRILRFAFYFFLLFILVVAMVDPKDKYYSDECDKR
jgi:hypothetical protein